VREVIGYDVGRGEKNTVSRANQLATKRMGPKQTGKELGRRCAYVQLQENKNVGKKADNVPIT
jgi:hypothetical protein